MKNRIPENETPEEKARRELLERLSIDEDIPDQKFGRRNRNICLAMMAVAAGFIIFAGELGRGWAIPGWLFFAGLACKAVAFHLVSRDFLAQTRFTHSALSLLGWVLILCGALWFAKMTLAIYS